MSRRVLIIPDKFKGTMTAAQAAGAIADGWRKEHRNDKLTCLPMTDGGDGFGEVMGLLLGAERQQIKTLDAAHRPRSAWWWWAGDSRTAIIESAAIVGLAQLPHGVFHPFQLDTFGLGAVLRAARKSRAQTCIIGIGGSATNDGGFGVARAVGWKFRDADQRLIHAWTRLRDLTEIEAPETLPWFPETRVVADVRNPLLGARGASRIYGPQKGLRPEDMKPAEACLSALARQVRRNRGQDLARCRGSGAAGGLGFGLRAFLGARMEQGFDLFARYARLREVLRNVDLVITGEGSLDASSLMGKGVGRLAQWCDKAGVPCIGLAGHVSPNAQTSHWFSYTLGMDTLTERQKALQQPERWLREASRRAAREWGSTDRRRP